MRSIAYISHDALTEGIGMSQIRPLVKGLAKQGWKTTLVSMEKGIPSPQAYEELKRAGVAWIPLQFGHRGKLSGIFRLVRLVLFLPKADVYHCRGDLAAMAVALRGKKNFVWDVRGLWGEQKIVIGTARDNKITKNLFLFIERFIARRAGAVTALAKALFPVLEERANTLPKIREVIPTCVDLDLFQLKREFPAQNTLLLSGVFNNYYDIEEMKSVITSIRKELNLYVIWCRGAESDRIKLDVGEDEIRIKKQNEMPVEIQSASFGMAICKSNAGISLVGVMPTKVAEFLAAGRPIIVSSGMGDLDDLILKNRVGVVIESGKNHKTLASELLTLLKDENTPIRCRKVAERHFNMNQAIKQYENLYFKIIESSLA
jgi:glycosyltransferase involved in cell wall biosynthesis